MLWRLSTTLGAHVSTFTRCASRRQVSENLRLVLVVATALCTDPCMWYECVILPVQDQTHLLLVGS